MRYRAMIALILIPVILFGVDNADFFEQAAKEREQGYDLALYGQAGA